MAISAVKLVTLVFSVAFYLRVVLGAEPFEEVCREETNFEKENGPIYLEGWPPFSPYKKERLNEWYPLVKLKDRGIIQLKNKDKIIIGCAGRENYIQIENGFKTKKPRHYVTAECRSGKLEFKHISKEDECVNIQLSGISCTKENEPSFKMVTENGFKKFEMFFQIDSHIRLLFIDGLLDAKKNALYSHVVPVPLINTGGKRYPNDSPWKDEHSTNLISSFYADIGQRLVIKTGKEGARQYENANHYLDQCFHELTKEGVLDNAKRISRGHLTANSDFNYAFERASTYYLINTAPQWQITNGGNFQTVEQYVQRLVKTSKRELDVYTGTHGTMKLTRRGEPYDVVDKEGAVRIPEVFWKIVFDKTKKECVVFIVFNNACTAYSQLMDDLSKSKDCKDQSFSKNSDEYLYGVVFICESIAAVKEIFESETPNEIAQLDPEVKNCNKPLPLTAKLKLVKPNMYNKVGR